MATHLALVGVCACNGVLFMMELMEWSDRCKVLTADMAWDPLGLVCVNLSFNFTCVLFFSWLFVCECSVSDCNFRCMLPRFLCRTWA